MRNNEQYEYKSVSGAWCKNPKFYCTYHKAYLTEKQAGAHKCWNKHGKGICYRLYTLDRKGVRVSNEKKLESLMEKMLDRLTNIDMKTGKLLKQIEKLQNTSKNIDINETELTGVYMTGPLEYTDKEIRIKYEDDGK